MVNVRRLFTSSAINRPHGSRPCVFEGGFSGGKLPVVIDRRVDSSALEWNSHRVDLAVHGVLRVIPPMLIPLIEFVAALGAALFAGAALYINVAEHPSRMGLETRMAALQWAPSYKRATWLQAPLAILSLLCGVAVWLLGGGWGWLVAGGLGGAVVSFRFLI